MKNSSSFWALLLFVVSVASLNGVVVCSPDFGSCQPMIASDPEIFKFAMNFQFLEGEFFLHGAFGKGFDAMYPNLTFGGPPPIGVQIANLEPSVRKIIGEFGYEEVGQLKAVMEMSGGGLERPLLNLSKESFTEMFEKAFGFKLNPLFDPYKNTINYLVAGSIFSCLGQQALVKVAPALALLSSRGAAAALLPMEAGQCSVIRALLYERANEIVVPYNLTVADFLSRTAALVNRLAKCGPKDEGVVVPPSLGAENRTETNVLAGDSKSLSYSRTVQEILRVLYGTGDERKPGFVFPKCANGLIPRSLGCVPNN